MHTSDARLFRRLVAASLTVTILGSCPVPEAAAGAEPCHVATIDLSLVSASTLHLWDLEFDVDPSTAGSSFLKRNAVLSCELAWSPCTGCVGGGGTLEEGTGVATFQFHGGYGYNEIDIGQLIRCQVATNGSLPSASDFEVSVTSAAGVDDWPYGPLLPATATVEVNSVTCGAACGSFPRNGCRSAGSSSLVIDPFQSRKLMWKWKHGDGLDFAALSDPTTSGHYTVCMYPFHFDESGYPKFIEEQRLPLSTGWKALGTRGYIYRDNLQSMGPVRRLRVRTGNPGHTSVVLRSDDPREEFVPATDFRMQLIDPKNDLCWESAYWGYEPNDNRFEGTTGD